MNDYEITIEKQIVKFNEDIRFIIEEVEMECSSSPYITNSTFTVQHNVMAAEDSTILEVKNNHASGEHSFDINLTSDDNEILLSQTIYIYSDGINDYVSETCFEESRDLYYRDVAEEEDLVLLGFNEPTENTVYTKSEYEAYNEYQSFVYKATKDENNNDILDVICNPSYTPKDSDNIIKVNGYIKWTDIEGNKHPLVYNKVELRDDDLIFDDVLGTSKTDINGYFEFDISTLEWSISGSKNLYVAFYPENSATKVTCFGLEYKLISTMYVDISDDKIATFNIVINDNEIRTGSYEVSQMMIYPRLYGIAMSNSSLPPISVFYPSGTNGSFCAPLVEKNGYVGLLGVSEKDTHSWDTGTHEYGHYLAHYFNMTYLQLGDHYFDKDQSDEYKYRWFGNKLAWSEGLATYLGFASQLYFNLSELNIPGLGDTMYLYFYSKDIYLQLGDFKRSEANEFAITYFLLDLMDDDNSPNDSISFGHQQMWDLLTTRLNKNLCDFIELLDITTVDKKNQIGTLEEYYGFSAKNLSSSALLNLTYSNNIFSWYFNTDSDSLSKLSYYDLVFYSVDLSQSYTIENISTTTYTLTSEDLENILQFNSHTIYWQVIGYNDRYGTFDEIGGVVTNPFTGGYISSLIEIAKSTVTSEIGLEGAYYGSLIANDCTWYKITAPVSGNYTFESIGDWDLNGELFENIVINSSISGRIAYDSDSGTDNNFKLNYYLNEGQVLYLRVKGGNQYTSGSFYLKITINHSHTYSYYVNNSTSHRVICECGNESVQPHAVSVTGSSRFKPCLLCGYMVDTGTTPGIVGPLNNKKNVSINGSYILPNGIIVLVEEDVESYLNETLVFEEVIVDDDIIT